jgi:hypothetical protein
MMAKALSLVKAMTYSCPSRALKGEGRARGPSFTSGYSRYSCELTSIGSWACKANARMNKDSDKPYFKDLMIRRFDPLI